MLGTTFVGAGGNQDTNVHGKPLLSKLRRVHEHRVAVIASRFLSRNNGPDSEAMIVGTAVMTAMLRTMPT
jgi:hypothetical protein